MKRPQNIGDLSPDIQYYILHLEKQVEILTEKINIRSEVKEMNANDALTGLYKALSMQLNRINEELMGTNISFREKNDKTYDRFWKAMVDSKDVATNLLFLKKELKIKDEAELEADKNPTRKPLSGNVLEQMVKDEIK